MGLFFKREKASARASSDRFCPCLSLSLISFHIVNFCKYSCTNLKHNNNTSSPPKPKEFQKNSQKIPKEFLKNSQTIPKEFPKNSQRIHKEFTKNSQRIPKEFPKNSPKIPK